MTPHSNILYRHLLPLALAAALFISLSATFDKRTLNLVSANAVGEPGNSSSHAPTFTADGRQVAFASTATNLVSGDGNGSEDIFVKVLDSGAIVRVSTNAEGREADGDSTRPMISADGSFVVFESAATNLAPGASGSYKNVFVKDLKTGKVSLASAGADGNEANRDSVTARISADGRYVAFATEASNLIPGDTNEALDVYVKDMSTGSIGRASVGRGGEQGNGSSGDIYGPSISADGMTVAFSSSSSNLAPADQDSIHDIYLKDMRSGEIRLASLSEGGVKGNGNSLSPGLSANGKRVVFRSQATNLDPLDTEPLQDVYVKDIDTGRLILASATKEGVKGNMPSWEPAISPDGGTAAFTTESTNLWPLPVQQYHVFAKDLQEGSLGIVSANSAGVPADGSSLGPSLFTDGRRVALGSNARNLVAGAGGDIYSVFIVTFETGAIEPEPEPIESPAGCF